MFPLFITFTTILEVSTKKKKKRKKREEKVSATTAKKTWISNPNKIDIEKKNIKMYVKERESKSERVRKNY